MAQLSHLPTITTMTYDLLCLGNPLLDLQADVTPEYLEKYGLKPNDAILIEDKHKPIFEEVLQMDNVHILAGGAAQNAARGAAYILPSESVVYFGSVGEDVFSDKLRAANEKAGVACNYMVHKDIPTGKCAALITGDNRSLATDLAAANHYKLSHLQAPENWKLVEDAKVFYVGGFHWTVCPEAINALGKHAAETNKPFIINLSAPFLSQFFKEAQDSSAPYWDYLIGNESEAIAYAESHNLGTTDIEEIALAITKLPKANEKRDRIVIITQGLDDTIVAQNGTTKKIPVHPLPANKLVDSNGAGDAFAGGFLGGIVQGKSLEESIDIGQWLAAESLQLVGPSFPEVKKPYQKA